jgi:hypothetical protein
MAKQESDNRRIIAVNRKWPVETSRMLREAGCPFIVVVGHSHYYPRFGFAPAKDSEGNAFSIWQSDPNAPTPQS